MGWGVLAEYMKISQMVPMLEKFLVTQVTWTGYSRNLARTVAKV